MGHVTYPITAYCTVADHSHFCCCTVVAVFLIPVPIYVCCITVFCTVADHCGNYCCIVLNVYYILYKCILTGAVDISASDYLHRLLNAPDLHDEVH